jgi:hypothetical protein
MLTFGVLGLSSAEVQLLRTILRLSNQINTHWQLVDPPQGALDLQLVSVEYAELHPLQIPKNGACLCLPVLARGVPAKGALELERPLKAEAFILCLSTAKRLIIAGWEVNAKINTKKSVPSNKSVSAAPIAAPIAALPLRDGKFKLTRWPPQSLLLQQPHWTRMAIFLLHQPLGAADLSRLSRRPEAACMDLLQVLDAQGLLVHSVAQPLPLQKEGRVAKPKPRYPSVKQGLLQTIRRSLKLA